MKEAPNIDFPGKQTDEVVRMLLRRHPFLLIRQNLIYILYFIVPPVLYFLGKSYFSFILSFPIYPIFILLTSLYYFFFLFFLLVEWIDFYFDAWIVTNKRLIDVEQIGIFRRSVSETRLEKIQDVTFEVKGIFGTIFHYGSITVQTAGAAQNFTIKQISDPAQIKTQLLSLYDERIRQTGVKPEATVASQVTDQSNPQTIDHNPPTPTQNTPTSSTPLSTPQAPSTKSNNSDNIIKDIK